MTLMELIIKLQYLATFVDNPAYVRVHVVDEFNGVVFPIKQVEFTDDDDDLVGIII